MEIPPLNGQNLVSLIIMVSVEPEAADVLREVDMDPERRQELLDICLGLRHIPETQLEALVKPVWAKITAEVESRFYARHTPDVFDQTYANLVNRGRMQANHRWASRIIEILTVDDDLVSLLVGKYREFRPAIDNYRTGQKHGDNLVLSRMLCARRVVIDRMLDQYAADGGDDPRMRDEDIRPEKISLDGEIVDIPATPEALKECLDSRREYYLWDGITTEHYVKDGQERRRVIFYMGNRR